MGRAGRGGRAEPLLRAGQLWRRALLKNVVIRLNGCDFCELHERLRLCSECTLFSSNVCMEGNILHCKNMVSILLETLGRI